MKIRKYVIALLIGTALTQHAEGQSILTQFKIQEKGSTLSAPKVTSQSGTPFVITIGPPNDGSSLSLQVGAILKGVTSANEGLVHYELAFVARDVDSEVHTDEIKVRAYTAREYVISGRAVFDKEVKIELAEDKFILLKFSEAKKAEMPNQRPEPTRTNAGLRIKPQGRVAHLRRCQTR